jgi:hypothetical protein
MDVEADTSRKRVDDEEEGPGTAWGVYKHRTGVWAVRFVCGSGCRSMRSG